MAESDHEHDEIERLRRAMYSRQHFDEIRERPRRELSSERSVVGEDWKRPEEGVPKIIAPPPIVAIARYGVRLLFAFSLLFFLVASGFFAYYFAVGSGASMASSANIDIAITGPARVAGGEPTKLQIVVTNRNSVPLELADLVVSYPPGARAVRDLATDLSSDPSMRRISLGEIEPGGRRQGTLAMAFVADAGTEATVKVELEYRLRGSSAIFVASSEYVVSIGSAPITVDVSGNTETVSGQPVEMRVTISSNASALVRDVLLSAGFPFGFTLSSAAPAPTRGAMWELGDFMPGQRREILLRGVLVGPSGDERTFHFTAGTRKSKETNAIEVPLSNSSLSLRISQPFLGLSLSANSVSGEQAIVAPGSLVNVYISWQNNLSTPVADAVIVARLSGVEVEGTAVRVQNGFYRSTDSTVLWNKTTDPTLANLPAGAKGVVTFSFQVPDTDVIKALRDPYLTISVNAAGKRYSESGVPENLQSAITQRIGLSSDVVLAAQGLYYANPFGSIGPLPPKAGVETTYGIAFMVTNTTNQVREARLTARMPPYVRLLGKSRTEDISYNLNDGSILWNIGTIEPGVGTVIPARQAAIGIGFTPSTSQIGQSPVLLQDIEFSGIDEATGERIEKRLQNLTTDLSQVSKTSASISMPIDPGFSSMNAVVVR